MTAKALLNQIAVVAGATRGAGRGIACMLGEAGATVYCTGRSSCHKPKKSLGTDDSPFQLESRPETIEDTAEMVSAYGGIGIPVCVDHTEPAQVTALFDRIKAEHNRLDILVNDVWGGDALTQWGKPFWEHSLADGLLMQERAVHSHLITAHHATPLLIAQKSGLIVEITDGHHFQYRGNLFYDLVKTSLIRLAFTMACELKPHNVSVVAVTPGFLRSEAMLEHFGVTEANWQDGAKIEPHFIASETPFYVGRAVAALAADPNIATKSGRVFSSWDLAAEYGLTDVDGRQPNFARHLAEHAPELQFKPCDDAFYAYW